MLLPSGVVSASDAIAASRASSRSDDPLHGDKQGRAAIAQRDRAGLVQEQRVDVAGDLDGLAALGDQVGGQGAVHAGDPDRRQQGPDRRRDQADQERDQGRDVERDVEVARHRVKRRRHDQEDDRERGQDDGQRDLVGGLLPRCPFDQGDHPVEEAFADARGHLDDDPVGKDPRSAGHARPVASGLADHRRALARDRRLVDRGHPFDDLAVGRNDLPGLDHHAVARLELGRGDLGRLARRLELDKRSYLDAWPAGSAPGPCRALRPAPRQSWRRAPSRAARSPAPPGR